MKLIDSAEFRGGKIYFTEADPVLMKQESISEQQLSDKLKAWLLLTDNIFISGSHMMSSPAMVNIVEKNPRLLSDGAIVPSIRNDIKSFSHYLEIKETEEDTSFSEQGKSLDRNSVAGFLDSATSKAAVWTPDTAIQLFQQSLVHELLNKDSELRKKLVGITKKSVHELAEDIANADFVSRGVVNRLGQQYLGNRSTILSRHSNFLYYLWGATHLYSEPVLHPDTFNLGVENLNSTMVNLREQLRTNQRVESRENEPSVLESILDEFGIVADAVSRIPFNSILDLRASREAINFREKWHKILVGQRDIRINSTDTIDEEIDTLRSIVKRELGKEFELARKVAKSRKYISYGSFVTSGLVTLFAPEIGLAGLAASAAGVDPLVEAVQKKIPGMEISIFCAKVQNNVSEAP